MRYCSHCRASYEAAQNYCPVDGAAIVEAAEPIDPLVGRTIGGRYLVRQLIGKGGMGVVYEAEHVGLDKRVAIKFLLDRFNADPEVVARFHREARTASRIGHENIIDVTDVGADEDGRSYIVMELLTGADLAQVLRTSGQLPVERSLHLIHQICRGLAAAHDKGVIHRDMKPENVFLTERNGVPDTTVIMDFGISKIIDAHDSKVRLTSTGTIVGTPLYMAPEQALATGVIDHRVNIYATGVMLYEMLCGRPPFMAPTYLAVVAQHLNEKPPPPRALRPDLAAGLERVILRALEKRPERRFATIRELGAALPPGRGQAATRVDRERAAVAPSATAVEPLATPARAPALGPPARSLRTPALLVGGAALIAAAMVTVAALARRSGDEVEAVSAEPPPPDANPLRVALAAIAPSAEPVNAGAGAMRVEPLPTTGSLKIDSVPRGAEVWLDGTAIGVTPITLDAVASGPHRIRLAKARHQPLEAGKTIRPGYAEAFFGALAAQPAAERRPSARAEQPPQPEPAAPAAAPPATVEPAPPPPVEPPRRKPPAGDHKPNPYLKK